MNQEEFDKLQELARKAVTMEIYHNPEVSKAWREFAVYVMQIAANRANLVLKAHEEGIL